MAKVFYFTPFKEGDIGGGINECIELLPADAWVCIRDSDTLFLTGNAQRQIQEIADSNPQFDLIGCKTNRLRSYYVTHDRENLFECDSITKHIEAAKDLEAAHWAEVGPLPFREVVAGMFMLMRVSTWKKFKIPEKTPFFDTLLSRQILLTGGKLGIAKGIYLFHLYRWGSEDPCNAIEHLFKK